MPASSIDPTGEFFVFTYELSDAAANDPNTTVIVEYTADSFVTWADVTEETGVTVEATDNGPTDTIEVRIPLSLAAPDTKLFVRLSATVDLPQVSQ